jgi:uncharacterized protein involved in high-affinity Fe2+ transport
MPFRIAAVHSVRVELYPHTIGVKAAEIDFHFEPVLASISHDLDFAKA